MKRVARFGGKVVVEIPGYQILREIGASARASVYLALQESLERQVALKVMAPALAEDPAFVKRFLQEARTLASLAHPNIVAVYDVDVEAGNVLFFSMQYLPGGDFAVRVQHGIGEPELVAIIDEVGQALDYVHQRGLIHRDVSPRNVLFDASDAPVLTDFGIARAVGPAAGNTGTNFSASSGHYMSPEQARGGNLDARADIYSLGALTYFGLTGKPPFDGPDGFAVAYAHVFEPVPRLPPALAHWQKLIDQALAKDPAQRFANAADFLTELNVAARGPVPAVASAAMVSAPTVAQARLVSAPIETPPVATPPATPETVLTNLDPASSQADSEKTLHRVLPEELVAAAIAAPSSPPIAAPSESPPNRRLHLWPLLLIAAGIVAIAAAVYIQFTKHDPSAQQAPVAQVTANTDSSAAPNPPPATSPAGSPPGPDASAPTGATAETPAAATDAGVIGDAAAVSDEFSDVTDLSKVPTVVDPYVEALRLGRISLAAQRLTAPPGNNALEYFQFALKRDAKSKYAKQGILDIAKKIIDSADKSRNSGDLTTYLQLLGNADDVAKTLDEGADLRKDVAARRVRAAEPYLAQARAAAAEWDKSAAKAGYEKALQIDPASVAARDGLKFVATIGEPGFVFHDKLGDGSQGPQLIVLGNGKIAAAQRDVTRGEFRRYWNAAGRAAFAGKEPGCRDRESFFRSSKERNWQNPGFEQDDSHPVVCVNWAEAAAYAQWLSRETGKKYRLLTVGEFDQIAGRASADCTTANIADAAFNKKYTSRDAATCDDGFAETAPVGHFEPSGGLYDASGNVRVWVAACGGGSAVPPSGACRDYLAKGRAWLSMPKEAANFGDSFGADVALNSVGFRIVREIEK
jgi:serine/threonine protein kinase/tetratricopeptide (TPR) repeat protein